MNITITGNLGAGKSTVCKILEKYGFKVVTAGGLFRQIADERGISVVELNELAKTDKSIDDTILLSMQLRQLLIGWWMVYLPLLQHTG